MNKWLVTTSALAFISLASQAQADSAQRWPNWYVGISEGVTFLQPTDLTSATSFNRASYQNGSATTFSLGYMPPSAMWPVSNMRIEAEGGYHYNSVKNIDGVSGNGTMHMWSYMGDLYYDFRNSSQWTPYIGGGAGEAKIDIGKSGAGAASGSDSVFAYQAMAGIAYAPTSLPNTEWNLGYRYFDAMNPEFNSATGNVKSSDIRSNSAELGAKFRF